jgi:hypothetical protein
MQQKMAVDAEAGAKLPMKKKRYSLQLAYSVILPIERQA